MHNVDRELNELFMLPLTEFTAGRNTLLKRLKDAGRGEDAARVKALAKPSISAWAVNQLYWKHRRELDNLLKAGSRLGQAHASQLRGKAADVHGPLAARREAVSVLLQLAVTLLGDAGHNATPDILRRIVTTLETLSASSPASNIPPLGRLTEDVGPLGFESMAVLVPGLEASAVTKAADKRVERGKQGPAPKQPSAAVALETAERALRETRALAEDVAKKLRNETALASQKQHEQRQAEEHFAKAKAAAEEAQLRVRAINAEAEQALKALHDSEQAVEKARSELKLTSEAK